MAAWHGCDPLMRRSATGYPAPPGRSVCPAAVLTSGAPWRGLALLLLGLAHGVADLAAGLVVFSLPQRLPLADAAALVVLYNALAFGGQLLCGPAVDRGRQPRVVLLSGLVLLGAALGVSEREPAAAAGLAGVGSAAFHVAAGALALAATPGRTSGPGWFAAPGVLGFGLAGVLVAADVPAVAPALWELPTRPAPPAIAPIFAGQELPLLLLLLAVGLRSAAWNSLPFLVHGDVYLLSALGLGATVGKALGGLLADRVGWRRWTVGALLAATLLLAAGGEHPALLVPGVALLQSVTPVSLAAAARLLPGRPATAAAFVLGLGIAVGCLALFSGASAELSAAGGLSVLGAATLVPLYAALRRVEHGRPPGATALTPSPSARTLPRGCAR